MKATIVELFDTGRDLIAYDNSEFDRPTRVSDLSKCDNVLYDKRDKTTGSYTVMIDNILCQVRPNTYSHIGGTIRFLEVEF